MPHTLSVQSIACIGGARFLKEKFKEIHSFLKEPAKATRWFPSVDKILLLKALVAFPYRSLSNSVYKAK